MWANTESDWSSVLLQHGRLPIRSTSFFIKYSHSLYKSWTLQRFTKESQRLLASSFHGSLFFYLINALVVHISLWPFCCHVSLSGELTSTEVRRLSNSQSFFPLNMAPSFLETFTKDVLLLLSNDFCCWFILASLSRAWNAILIVT